jgi:hypothetical protein
VQEKKFTIWTAGTIDDGIEILTGVKAGSVSEEGTVFYLVNKMLNEYAQKLKLFGEGESDDTTRLNMQTNWISDIVE